MDLLIQLLQNNTVIILVMFIITVLSGLITIILGWKRFYNDVLSKKITLPVYSYLFILFVVLLIVIFRPITGERSKALRTIEGESFGVQRIYLDGMRFINCNFDGTELVYKGEAGFELRSNQLQKIAITLEGSAATTARFFSQLYADPAFRPIVESTFEQIKKGNLREATLPSNATKD